MSKRKKIECTVCALVALSAVIFLFKEKLPYKLRNLIGFVSDSGCGLINDERQYQEIQMRVLAEKLAENYSGNGQCLLIHHPVSTTGLQDIGRFERALKKGLGDKVKEVYLAPIKNVNMNVTLIPEEVMMENTADDFNKVIAAYPYCDLVVTLVPLPFSEKELYKMDIFKMVEDPGKPGVWHKDLKQEYPTFGVLNGYVGNLEPLFNEGLIQVMTLWRPEPTITEDPVPDDYMEAFSERYTFITPENVTAAKEKYPDLFPKPKK